ncbi:MAG: hypothetical protein PHY08_07580 [Candidatus Cloacimonetes bacterium]|nr:hypothetical protein [Candidatus Cloacimonadota bacterium]MDD4156414.1 hypothetical protein [Candidatus Cloacimonadota bacterium]
MKENLCLLLKIYFKKSIKILCLLCVVFLMSCDGENDDIINFDTPYSLKLEKVEEGQLKLSWSYRLNSDEVNYIVARKNGDENWNENYSLITNNDKVFYDNISSNSYNVYSYKVKADNKVETIDTTAEANFSATVSYFPEVTMPTNLSITQIAQNELILSWEDNVSGETGYKIDKKINNQDWIIAYATIPENSLEYTEILDEAVNLISYRIYAFVGESSGPANEISFTPTLQLPTDLTATQISDTQVSLSWNYTSDLPNFFEIQRQVGTNDWQDLNSIYGENRDYTDTPEFPTATFSYRVRAIKDTLFSSYSNETSINFNIQEISSIDNNEQGTQMYYCDLYIYLANSYSGVKILNVSNPTAPIQIATINIESKTTSVYVDDDILYVINDNNLLQLFDVSNVSNPIKISELQLYGEGYQIKVISNGLDKYALVASGSAGLIVVKVNQVDSPYLVAVDLINTMGNCVGFDYKNGQLFLADSQNGLLVYQVNGFNVEQLDYHLNSISYVNSVILKDDFLYLTSGNEGFSIYNKNTYSPLSQLDTHGFSNSISVNNNNLFLSDKDNGLLVYSVSNPLKIYNLCHLEFNEDVIDVYVRNRYAYILTTNSFKVIKIRS